MPSSSEPGAGRGGLPPQQDWPLFRDRFDPEGHVRCLAAMRASAHISALRGLPLQPLAVGPLAMVAHSPKARSLIKARALPFPPSVGKRLHQSPAGRSFAPPPDGLQIRLTERTPNKAQSSHVLMPKASRASVGSAEDVRPGGQVSLRHPKVTESGEPLSRTGSGPRPNSGCAFIGRRDTKMMLIRPRWMELLKNSEGTMQPGTTSLPVGSSPTSRTPTDHEAGHAVRSTSNHARITLADVDAAIRA